MRARSFDPAAPRLDLGPEWALRLTRRESLRRLALVAASVGFAPQLALAVADPAATGAAATPDSSKETSLHQDVQLRAPPARVYGVLLSAKEFSAFTGLKAEVAPIAGRAFSLFGGLITGRNIELVPGQRIVQAWRSASWSPGVYSVVRFALATRASGTLLALDHTGFPEGQRDSLDAGWRSHYWDPLKTLFG